MAVIYSQQGKPLRITTDDALWLARAVEAEGEPRTQVAQTLVNRWAMFEESQPGVYPTLTSLVRAYSQPVNPEWFAQGKLLARYLDQHPEQAQDQLQRAWKREHVHSTRGEFSERTRRAVHAALYGPLLIPRGALHFGPDDATPGVNRIYLDKRRNVLYQPELRGGLQHGHAVLFSGRPHAVIGFMLLAGGGLAAFVASHRRRRLR